MYNIDTHDANVHTKQHNQHDQHTISVLCCALLCALLLIMIMSMLQSMDAVCPDDEDAADAIATASLYLGAFKRRRDSRLVKVCKVCPIKHLERKTSS